MFGVSVESDWEYPFVPGVGTAATRRVYVTVALGPLFLTVQRLRPRRTEPFMGDTA